MEIQEFLALLRENPREVTFKKCMKVIDGNYNFTPRAFVNGDIENKAGDNNGSCKIFSFCQINNLTKEESLACFGEIYFDEVLQHPEGEGHQNIRNFVKYGWEQVQFNAPALQPK